MRLPVAIVLALLVGVGIGCTPPGHRAYVAGEIARRTGYDLAPEHDAVPRLPPGVHLDGDVSDDEAARIALWNSAAFRELLAELGLSRAALIAAGQLPNPSFAILFPLGPKQLEFALKLPLEALWLRPKRLAAARADAGSAAERLLQRGLDLVRDVRVACADVRLASGRAQLAAELARTDDEIAAIAETRLRLGDISELETATARTAALLTHDERIRAERDLAITRERLRTLLGLAAEDPPLTLTAPPPPAAVPLERLLAAAFEARPDLRAAELAIEAAQERTGLSRLEILSLAGMADANGSGRAGFEIGPGLEVGVPLLNWNQGGIARADAELDRTVRHHATERARIGSEVIQAYTRLRKAEEEADLVATRLVPAWEKAVHLAEQSYAAGEVPYLSLLEATGSMLRARTRRLEAAADLERASAELERSVGERLAELAR